MILGRVAGCRLLEDDGQIVGCVADRVIRATFLPYYPNLAGYIVAEEPGQ